MSGSLWKAVDELTNARQVRLLRDSGASDWTQVPSLWAQLVAAVGTGGEQGGSGRSSRYRTPANLDCLELARTIRDVVVDALEGHAERPVTTRLPAPEVMVAIKAQRAAERSYDVNRLTPLPTAVILVPDSLRHLASVVAAASDVDLTGWWTYRVYSWGRQITTTLGLTEQSQPRRIRDTACPVCAATHVTLEGDDGPERVPALLIDFQDGYVRAAECTACASTWFRGDALLDLADMIATRRPIGDTPAA